jgi:hypothetical protein
VTIFFRQVDTDGTAVNGVEMVRWNDEGLITEFKVRLQPLPGYASVGSGINRQPQRR